MKAMASSSVSTETRHSTGPKISSLYMVMEVFTPEKIVGPTKLPSGYPGTLMPRPSSSSFAPSFTPASMSESTRACAVFEMSGPRSAPCSVPQVTFSDFALATMSGIQSFALPRARPR